MRKYLIPGVLLLVTSFMLVACEDWVLSTEEPIDVTEDVFLDDPAEIPFLITGVEARFAFTWTRLGLIADLTADQLIFDEVMDLATFPTYRDIASNFRGIGDQTAFSNNTIRNAYNPLNNWRLLSDDLLERVERIESELSEDLRDRALFTGNFYGALARYMIGFYFEDFACGENAAIGTDGRSCIDQFGAPIDRSPVIRAADMAVNEVLPRLAAAEAFATPEEVRIINTLRARMHLILGNYAESFAAAQNGMEPGDDPFRSLHSVQAANEYFFAAGDGRIQVIPDYRFAQYVEDNPEEAARVRIRQAPAGIVNVDEPRFQQDMYPTQASPMDFLTWQENHLILAELAALHGQAGDALALVNEVRDSHGISPLAGPVTQQVIIEERDKELFLQGLRIFDLLRFGIWPAEVKGTPGFGLTGQPVGAWRGIPIQNDERNDNPCIANPDNC
ncbi:SusD family protein [Cyclonatronum proteinivorum]|uniref:SusD family protein n=1 Tax=Cyclonatronum proteinivorum TaxID=1457365 RepID=A0A345UGB7_9BACT|nr:RagB/SusD family nutrient uptake outer membrane protein [Cyclonatronum proteinivorum]AXI99518.1 SusD family protein [Cyclonatronum proteinivorum]